MRLLLLNLKLVVIAITLATVSGFLFGVRASAANAKLKIGVLLPVSGTMSSMGQEVWNGVQLAVEDLNKEAKEFRLEAVLADDKSDIMSVIPAAKKLIQKDKVDLIVGPLSTSHTIVIAPLVKAARIPLVVPASKDPRVTQQGDFIFRINGLEEESARVMAKFARQKMGAKKAAILKDSASDYSIKLAQVFKTTFEQLGGTIVIEPTYVQGDQLFEQQLLKIRSVRADVAFVPGHVEEVGIIVRQVKHMGVKTVLLGTEIWGSPKIYEIAGGDAVLGHYYVSDFAVWDPSLIVKGFVKKYTERFKAEPLSLSALGYDSIHVIARALSRANSTEGSKLKEALLATRDFVGVTGKFSFDENRNPVRLLPVLETQQGRATLKARLDSQ